MSAKLKGTDCLVWLLTIAIVLGVCSLVGCGDFFGQPKQETIGEIITRQAAERRANFWIRVLGIGNTRDRWPRTLFTTRDAVELSDGTSVVCIGTYNSLWCKEAKTE